MIVPNEIITQLGPYKNQVSLPFYGDYSLNLTVHSYGDHLSDADDITIRAIAQECRLGLERLQPSCVNSSEWHCHSFKLTSVERDRYSLFCHFLEILGISKKDLNTEIFKGRTLHYSPIRT